MSHYFFCFVKPHNIEKKSKYYLNLTEIDDTKNKAYSYIENIKLKDSKNTSKKKIII